MKTKFNMDVIRKHEWEISSLTSMQLVKELPNEDMEIAAEYEGGDNPHTCVTTYISENGEIYDYALSRTTHGERIEITRFFRGEGKFPILTPLHRIVSI